MELDDGETTADNATGRAQAESSAKGAGGREDPQKEFGTRRAEAVGRIEGRDRLATPPQQGRRGCFHRQATHRNTSVG
ncbi:MAG TPA: hypothetical protein VF021_07110 [Longimicrobiales bacterium]